MEMKFLDMDKVREVVEYYATNPEFVEMFDYSFSDVNHAIRVGKDYVPKSQHKKFEKAMRERFAVV